MTNDDPQNTTKKLKIEQHGLNLNSELEWIESNSKHILLTSGVRYVTDAKIW